MMQLSEARFIGLAGKLAAVLLLAGVLVMPRPEGMTVEAQRLAAVTLAMAALWLTNAIPIAATSLIPLFAFPVLGIQDSSDVSKAYIDRNIFLFLGGFVIALGIEKWGLHRRIALNVVGIVGSGLRTVVLGFMAATGFLSMWISNTASTLLMLPIGLALIGSLRDAAFGETEEGPQREAIERDYAEFGVILLLAIAYSASIGGFTTLVGTPTNLQFVKVWNDLFPDVPPAAQIDVATWLSAVAPLGMTLMVLAWWIMTRPLARIENRGADRSFFADRLRELGRPSRAEIMMLVVFVTTAFLWITRKWLLASMPRVHDSTIAMGMALLMFFLPARKEADGSTAYLMDWQTAEKKTPWGILLLIGGGFAIAHGFQETELSNWIGGVLADAAAGWPIWLIVLSVCLLMTFLTEFTSNVATVAAVLPVLGATSVRLGIDPRLVMIPATVSASCAFMLPIATPPNAIVFGSGKIGMHHMVRRGFALNLVGAIVITLGTFFVVAPMLGISSDSLPDWARIVVD